MMCGRDWELTNPLSSTTRQVRDSTNTTRQPDTNTSIGSSDSVLGLVVVETRENKERQSSQVEEINRADRESHSLYLVGYSEVSLTTQTLPILVLPGEKYGHIFVTKCLRGTVCTGQAPVEKYMS